MRNILILFHVKTVLLKKSDPMYIPISKRIDGLTAWYNKENERPLVGFFIDSQYPLHRYHCKDKLPSGELHPKDIIITRFLAELKRLYQTYERL